MDMWDEAMLGSEMVLIIPRKLGRPATDQGAPRGSGGQAKGTTETIAWKHDPDSRTTTRQRCESEQGLGDRNKLEMLQKRKW